MNRKVFLKIFAGIAALTLILLVIIVANAFVGNPITASIAKKRAAEYINEKYGHLDLEIEKVTYNPKDGFYFISVISSSSVDTHFSLGYRGGAISRDDYEFSVLSGMNTMERFCKEYQKGLLSLLQAKSNEIVDISVLPDKFAGGDLEPDMAFDKTLVGDVELMIRCTGGIDAGHLTDILKMTEAVMVENGYGARMFSITGEGEGALTELWNIKNEHVKSENLEEFLNKAIKQGEYDGIISFSKSQKS